MSRLLRLASYNIHSFIGRDGEYTPARTLLQIEQLQAAVVALQEVRSDDRQGMEMLGRMACDCGYRLTLGPTMTAAPGHHYGNALLHPDNATEIMHHDLSRPGREPRAAIEARLELGGEPWRIFATHLGLSPGERRWQVRRLLQLIEADGDMNTILMGDLNEWFLWGRPLRWLKRYFRLSHQPPTFPSRRPLLALDRIWVYPCERLQSVNAVKTPLSRSVSDHLPLLAEIS